MPRKDPLPDWRGQDAYIVGGGPSLRGFDFDRLRDLNVVGCNQAFSLGPGVVKICIWGDLVFWRSFGMAMESFDGWVVTNYLLGKPPGWVHYFPRQQDGLSTTELGWNFNTGASAINLALILGARRVFLLGYDLGRSGKDEGHWHDAEIERACPEHFDRFQTGFRAVAQDLPVVFPGREVFNVTDGSSKLESFPRLSFKEAGLERTCGLPL